MTRTNWLKSMVCLLLLAAAPATSAMEADINFILGAKSVEEADWGQEGHGVFGVETTFGQPEWPIGIALDYLGSANNEEIIVSNPVPAQIDLMQATFELDFGVRKIWNLGKTRPFVGGGFSFLGAVQERRSVGLLTVDDTDGTVGVWFSGGSFWRLGKKFNIGIDFRMSAGEVVLFGREVQTGGATLGLLLGWGWGGGN